MNNFNFTGNLGRDSESRYTQNGDAIVSFSVACKSGYGEKAKTFWIRCSMYGKRAEAVSQYLIKGALVGISGEFSLNVYTDKAGVEKTSAECRVNDLTLLGARQPIESKPQSNEQNIDGFEDFVPF